MLMSDPRSTMEPSEKFSTTFEARIKVLLVDVFAEICVELKVTKVPFPKPDIVLFKIKYLDL